MAGNRLNRVFIRPAERETSDSDTGELNVNGHVVEKIAAGMNSGDFEQTIKAYAMFDRVSKGRLYRMKAA